jgi:hypothetical protein
MVTNYNLDIDLYRISGVTSATSNYWQGIRFSCCLYSDSLWRWKAGWLLMNFHKKKYAYDKAQIILFTEPQRFVMASNYS